MRNIGLRKEMMCHIKDAIHEEIDHNTIKRFEFYSWEKLDKYHKDIKFDFPDFFSLCIFTVKFTKWQSFLNRN